MLGSWYDITYTISLDVPNDRSGNQMRVLGNRPKILWAF